MSCRFCCDLADRHNYQNRIFTVNEKGEIISAISDNPEYPLSYKIKNGL